MVINEISDWIKYLLSVIPGKTGKYLRILYVSISMKRLAKVNISHGTILHGLKNIKFGTNVNFGPNSFISAIEGSIKIGDNVLIGGQAGISGHLKIGNNVQIGGGSGVIKNIPDNSKVMGYPAKDIRKFLKENK